MPTDQEIIDKLIQGEDYYNQLITDNRNYMSIGLPVRNLNKINSLFHITESLRFRVNRSVFDDTSDKLYYKIVRLLPINII